jgi:hypothetical protein
MKIGIVIGIVIQMMGIVWWAAKIDERVSDQEKWLDENISKINLINELEQRIVLLEMYSSQCKNFLDLKDAK